MSRQATLMQLPDGTRVAPVTDVVNRWSDDFGGTVLDTGKWKVETNVGGMTYSVANSNLTVVMGTTANAELRLLSTDVFTIPFDISAILSMSQRIANNSVYVELVGVDANGNPIANDNLAGDWKDRASLLLDGLSATSAKLETVGENAGAALSLTGTITTTAAQVDLMMEMRAKDVQLLSALPDNTNGRSASLLASSEVPSPNARYKVRLRFKNGASAPATPTSVVLRRVYVQDCQELTAEITSGRGDNGAGRAISVSVVNSLTAALSAGTAIIGLTKGQGTYTADVASAAITGTTTTAAFTPTSTVGSYQVVIPVTAVTGTSPTMDIVVQESDDGGTNWFDVYHMERITAVGVYRTPYMPITGNRVRYVQTIGGTTPSFTRSIGRNEDPFNQMTIRRRLISRTLDVNTLNNATPWINVEGCDKIEAAISLTFGTVSPTVVVELSDDASTVIYSYSSLSAWAATGIKAAISDVGGAKFARLRTSVAGTGNSAVIARISAWKA